MHRWASQLRSVPFLKVLCCRWTPETPCPFPGSVGATVVQMTRHGVTPQGHIPSHLCDVAARVLADTRYQVSCGRAQGQKENEAKVCNWLCVPHIPRMHLLPGDQGSPSTRACCPWRGLAELKPLPVGQLVLSSPREEIL